MELEGIDTITATLREGIELDITADGSLPFYVQWFDDVPDCDTGEFFIETELQEALHFWGMA